MVNELQRLQSVSVSNLRTQILDQMRNAILDGLFLPGQKLVETSISKRLGVSRAPLREALMALESEGLVVTIPRRGSFVVDIGDKDIEEIYSLRLLLECGALKRAMKRISEEDLGGMQRLVDDLGAVISARATRLEVVQRDMAFHETICRLADHTRLYSAWNSMRWQTRLLIGITSETHSGHPEEQREYHQVILNAIRGNDVGAAESAMVLHIQDAEQRALAAMHALRS